MQGDYDATVNAFYLAYYGRPADAAGLTYWSQQLDAAGGDFSTIIDAFSTSSEATARFGSDDASARITSIYEQLFDRAPDSAGLAYWLDAIDSGSMTLASAAAQIMSGAQGTDADLSALRLQAAESFTAAAAAGGVAYDGLAAIAAAQVLVKAVTLDATAADIATMVSETAKLVNAAANASVLDALATGTTLTALFDTARGSADPVGLLQTLADVAEVAAGDPATLDSLLRGGGMAKVLAVMPASATLTDVVKALAAGGLPAAVDVVYPTTSAGTPVSASVAFAFKEVSEGSADTHHDNVTNQSTADVTFSYSGTKLSSIATVEYSTDGSNWSSTGVTLDSAGKTVTIADLNLGSVLIGQSLPIHVDGALPVVADTTTTLYVRALDASGHVISPAAQQDIVYDGYAAEPSVQLVADSVHGTSFGSADDSVTNDGTIAVTGVETGATLEYALAPAGSSDSFVWTAVQPVAQEGENGFYVRQVDAAGNTSDAAYIGFTLDTAAPAAPTVLLATDSGTDATDRVTNSAVVHIGGLATAEASAWEYSLDGGVTWTFGALNDGSGSADLDLGSLVSDGQVTVEVRQYDQAGNVGDASTALAFTLDTTVAAVSFDKVVGADAATPSVTADTSADVVFSYTGTLAATDTVQYKIGSGAWQTVAATAIDTDGHTITLAGIDLSSSDPTISVQITDEAGNASAVASQHIDGPYTAPTYNVAVSTSGMLVSGSTAGHAYLVDSSGATEILSTDGGGVVGGGYTLFGAQATAVSGTLSIGADAASATTALNSLIALGTTGDDMLTGKYVWSFSGNDTLTGTSGTDFLWGSTDSSTFQGGAGADRIFIEGGTNLLVYTGVADSHIGSMDVVTLDSTSIVNTRILLAGVDFAASGGVYSAGFDPADASADALATALTQAYQETSHNADNAYLIKFASGSQYVIADYDSNGIIDSNDYVIQIVGTVTGMASSGSTVSLYHTPP